MSGTEFDPGTGTTGVDKIVSLTLPDVAVSTKAGTGYDASPFKNFIALTSVGGENITTLGLGAFSMLTGLTEATFPDVVTIGDYAFYQTSLAEADFPVAESLGLNAFSKTLLTEVSFPEVITLSNNVFNNNTVLRTADLPEATKLSSNLFSGCTALEKLIIPKLNELEYETNIFKDTGTATLTITMGAVAPKIKSKSRFSGTKGKTVIIRVPTGATGYDNTWQTHFKKDSSNLTLNFEYFDE
jgi:hypothetical protein